jgi:K+-sensing histidine kinase KdpD
VTQTTSTPLRVKEAFTKLSPKSKLIAFVVAFIVGCLLVAASGAIAYRISYARYNRKEAARMKQVQDALALAEAANRRAEAKEAQAELLKEQNEAKAKTTTADKARLESEAQAHDEQIRNAYQHDQDAINSDMSSCDCCRDICSRLDALAVSNPALAKYKCAANSCDDECAAGAE